jgi:hypothetical protein
MLMERSISQPWGPELNAATARAAESDIGLAADAAIELAGILQHLGPVADRLGSRAVIAQYEADIDDPAQNPMWHQPCRSARTIAALSSGARHLADQFQHACHGAD